MVGYFSVAGSNLFLVCLWKRNVCIRTKVKCFLGDSYEDRVFLGVGEVLLCCSVPSSLFKELVSVRVF